LRVGRTRNPTIGTSGGEDGRVEASGPGRAPAGEPAALRPALGGPVAPSRPPVAVVQDGGVTQVAESRPPGGGAERLRMLADLVSDGEVVVLSGAGLSTESGIPDYRGETGRRRRAEPMTYQEFTGSAAARRRYGARSHLGWRHVAAARPNAGHRAVAELQRRGLAAGIITQNVGGLRLAVGAVGVFGLLGAVSGVVCLACGDRSPRRRRVERLRAASPGWEGRVAAAQINPDGDAVLGEAETGAFRVVDCERCGGPL